MNPQEQTTIKVTTTVTNPTAAATAPSETEQLIRQYEARRYEPLPPVQRVNPAPAVAAAPAYAEVIDPRPPLKTDNEVHDFEVHREGAYAKKGLRMRRIPTHHVLAYQHEKHTAGLETTTDRPFVTTAGVDHQPGARRTELREDRLYDPRPPLKTEKEVHDYEVHREGGYAKGHTFPGVRPQGVGVITPTGAEGVLGPKPSEPGYPVEVVTGQSLLGTPTGGPDQRPPGHPLTHESVRGI